MAVLEPKTGLDGENCHQILDTFGLLGYTNITFLDSISLMNPNMTFLKFTCSISAGAAAGETTTSPVDNGMSMVG